MWYKKMLLDVPQISKLTGYTQDTVRRYFRKKVFHPHETGPDGISLWAKEESILVRFATLKRLRTDVRSLEKLGRAFAKVSNFDDKFIMDRLKAGVDLETLTEEFIAQVRESLAR